MFLPAFSFLFNLLLFFQLLGDASFPQGLPFATLICLSIQCCFQGSIPSHTDHDFLSQLWNKILKEKYMPIENKVWSNQMLRLLYTLTKTFYVVSVCGQILESMLKFKHLYFTSPKIMRNTSEKEFTIPDTSLRTDFSVAFPQFKLFKLIKCTELCLDAKEKHNTHRTILLKSRTRMGIDKQHKTKI